MSGKKKWTFRESTAVSPLRACTPHFKAQLNNLGKEGIPGKIQEQTDLYEQQLKVLRVGDPNFTANQHLGIDAMDFYQDDEVVVLGPGDVMYHPAGLKIICLFYAYFALYPPFLYFS